ncbi:hypothetical protein M138_4848 [Bacteroides fragilis str. S23L17]|nr:hypothetical protein M138_4848 [Bacteroides fragilis str. S23L17]
MNQLYKHCHTLDTPSISILATTHTLIVTVQKASIKLKQKKSSLLLIINILCYKNHVSKDVRFLKHYFYPSHWMQGE